MRGSWFVGTALVAVAIAMVPSAVAAPPAQSAKCTVKGTAKSERLHGTAGRDVICGRGGDDRIRSRGGNDVIRAGEGADVSDGGPGGDTILGGGGDDVILGAADDDKLDGQLGADQLFGGDGSDICAFGPDDRLDTDCSYDYSIRDVQIAPASIDTSEQSAAVTVTVQLVHTGGRSVEPETLTGIRVAEESDASIYGSPFMSFVTSDPPGQPLSLVAGDAESGTWSGTLTLPRYSAPGEHRISLLLIQSVPSPIPDLDQRFDPVPYQALQRAWLNYKFVQSGPGDTGGPVVESLEVTPRTVDTSGGPAQVSFRAHVTDDLRGTEDVNVNLDPPRVPNGISYGLQLNSGTPRDGIWTGTYSFPRWSQQGDHRLSVSTFDGLYRGSNSTDDLVARGIDTAIHQIGEDDSDPPTLTSLSATGKAGGVVFEIGLSDPKSGPFFVTLAADGPNGTSYPDLGYFTDTPISGTRANGVWRREIDLAPGTYTLSYIETTDEQRNRGLYRRGDLEAAGFPVTFTVPG